MLSKGGDVEGVVGREGHDVEKERARSVQARTCLPSGKVLFPLLFTLG